MRNQLAPENQPKRKILRLNLVLSKEEWEKLFNKAKRKRISISKLLMEGAKITPRYKRTRVSRHEYSRA